MPLKYVGPNGELRIKSGITESATSAGDAPYFTVEFANMDIQGPAGRPFAEETLVMSRNNLDANTHWISTTEEARVQPVQISFSADIDDTVNAVNLRKALSNPDRDSPWAVAGVSFQNVNGTTTIPNRKGVAISTPVPFDTNKERINVEMLWEGRTPGTTDDGYIWNEVWFAPESIVIAESDGNVRLSATGMCFGPISNVASFTGGISVI